MLTSQLMPNRSVTMPNSSAPHLHAQRHPDGSALGQAREVPAHHVALLVGAAEADRDVVARVVVHVGGLSAAISVIAARAFELGVHHLVGDGLVGVAELANVLTVSSPRTRAVELHRLAGYRPGN